MASFKDTLQEAIELTKEKGFEQSRAEWLMLDLFKWSRTDYLMHMYDEMSQAEEAKFWFSIILWISITSKFSMSYSTSRNRRSYASFFRAL